MLLKSSSFHRGVESLRGERGKEEAGSDASCHSGEGQLSQDTGTERSPNGEVGLEGLLEMSVAGTHTRCPLCSQARLVCFATSQPQHEPK